MNSEKWKQHRPLTPVRQSIFTGLGAFFGDSDSVRAQEQAVTELLQKLPSYLLTTVSASHRKVFIEVKGCLLKMQIDLQNAASFDSNEM